LCNTFISNQQDLRQELLVLQDLKQDQQEQLQEERRLDLQVQLDSRNSVEEAWVELVFLLGIMDFLEQE
jgi:hypothetical protein